MAEYVTKEAAIKAFENGEADVIEDYGDGCDFGFGLKNIKNTINAIPAADVAPVVHGKWDGSGKYTFSDGKTAVRCSECGCALIEGEYLMFNWNYCPVCGAKMDGGNADENRNPENQG